MNYTLEKYTGRNSRYTCPKCGRMHCFTRYVDETGTQLANYVGRCDHENSCGYHYTPKMFFAEHPQERKIFKPQPQQPKPCPKTDYIPLRFILRCERRENNLTRYLSKIFDCSKVNDVLSMYHVETTKDGEVIFSQIDIDGNCRTGKIIEYGEDGHRVKNEDHDAVDWVHRRYMKWLDKPYSEFNLKQCLFGEHLLKEFPEIRVCLVESEKTAIIMAILFPEQVWLATGGKHGLTVERCRVLAGRDVMLYPDADAVDEWRKKAKLLTFCRSVRISDWAKNEAPGSKRDIADKATEEVIKRKEHPTIQEEPEPQEQEVKAEEPQSSLATVGDVCQCQHELGIPPGRITYYVYAQ